MKKLFYTFLVASLISCQIEDKNAPEPDESFIRYLGVIADQQAKDIEPIFASDGTTLEGFVIFGTQQLEGSPEKDYYLVRTDDVGNILATARYNPIRPLGRDFDGDGEEDILSGDDIAGQIEVLPNGGFVIIGTTSINDNVRDLNNFRLITTATLDGDLNVIDSLTFPAPVDQANNKLSSIANDIIRLSDGSFLIVGAIETVSGDFDYYYRKVRATDGTNFVKTLGLSGSDNDDILVRAFETEDQTIALFGYSERSGNEGEEGTNVSYVEVNFNGNPTGGSGNFGIPDITTGAITREFDDVLNDVIQKPGGYMAVGTSTIDEQDYSFFMDIDLNGISLRKDTLSSVFDGGLNTQAFGISITRSNDFVIVGNYSDFRVGDEQRGQEAMFMRIDQVGEKVPDFESNYGLGDGNDTAADVITLSDGKIVVAATIDFGGGIQMIGLIKLNDSGELDR